jgi:mannose/fructose/N-acetylgalactosamine-specific phosphotransferase system component IID
MTILDRIRGSMRVTCVIFVFMVPPIDEGITAAYAFTGNILGEAIISAW